MLVPDRRNRRVWTCNSAPATAIEFVWVQPEIVEVVVNGKNHAQGVSARTRLRHDELAVRAYSAIVPRCSWARLGLAGIAVFPPTVPSDRTRARLCTNLSLHG